MSDTSAIRMLPHTLVPIVLCGLGIACQYTGVDEWLIAPFYDAEAQAWPYEDLWLTGGLIHKGGKDLIVIIAALLLLAVGASFFNPRIAKIRRDLIYVILGMGSGIGIVAVLKSSTHIYSPSKLFAYGGLLPHIRLFDHVPAGLPVGHAFPAGHASGAFGLISVYFILSAYGSKWRYPALGACLALGFIFGLAQQARGKHFFSHDLFALAICWAAALAVLYAMGLPARIAARRSATQP